MRIIAFDFSCVFRGPWRDTEGSHSETLRRSLQTIVDMRDGFDRVAICLDESLNEQGYPYRGASWRRWIEPNYKFNRDPMEASYFDCLRKAVDELDRNGCTIFWAPEISLYQYGGPVKDWYAEADDVLASLAGWCATKPTKELLIYSADKDLLQCVRDDIPIRVLRDRDGEPWNEARVTNEFVKAKEDGKDVRIGVHPRLIPCVQALAREGADNFACFPGWTDPPPPDHPEGAPWRGVRHNGIGTVSAVRLFRDQGFKSLEEIVAAAQADSPKIGKHLKEVIKRAAPDAATKGWRLAKLTDNLPINFAPLMEQPKFRPSVQARDYLVEEPMAQMEEESQVAPDQEQLAAIDNGVDEAKQREQAAEQLVAAVVAEAIAAGREKNKLRYEQAIIGLKAGFEAMGMSALVSNAITHIKASVKVALATEQAPPAQDTKAESLPPETSAPRPLPPPAQAVPPAPAAAAPPTTAIVAQEATPAYMRAAKPTTATLVKAPAKVNRFALQPQNWNTLWTMAECLADSGLYPHLGTPQKVAAVMLEANERGMMAATACRLAHVVNGRVGWAASAFMAWVEESGLVEYINVVETTHERCTIEFKRSKNAAPAGQIVRHEFTIEDAKKNGYLGDKGYPVWKSDPKAMLVAACKRTCARTYFDRIVANVYTPDEIDNKYQYDVAA